MRPAQLLAHFDRVCEAPGVVPRLRRFILDLAVRGKLVEQDPGDEPAVELLRRIQPHATADEAGHPRNWVSATVGVLCEFQYGKALSASARTETGAVPVFGSNGVIAFFSEALCEEPTIIVGRKGSAGALNLCDGPSWTTDVAYYIRPPSFYAIRFLLVALEALDLGQLGKGVKPGLSRNDAYDLRVLVPPLSEQHRIVAKVDELMALCDRLEAAQAERERRRDRLVAASLKRLNEPASAGEAREHVRFHLNHLPRLTTRREQVKELREAILNLAVAGRLVPRDSSEEGANALVERIRSDKNRPPWRGALVLGESSALPVGWEAVGLGNLCRFVTSGSRGWAEFYSATGPKFIRAQNIRFGRLLLKDLARVTPPDKREKARTQVSKGDLLIVITGAGVTHPAVLDEDLGEAYISQHVSSLRPALTELSPWLLLWLMAPAGGRAELVHRAYGAGKPGLNLENIRSLTTHVPPMAEQHRIVAKVDELMAVCDKLEAQLSASETESTRLLEATLHQALAVA